MQYKVFSEILIDISIKWVKRDIWWKKVSSVLELANFKNDTRCNRVDVDLANMCYKNRWLFKQRAYHHLLIGSSSSAHYILEFQDRFWDSIGRTSAFHKACRNRKRGMLYTKISLKGLVYKTKFLSKRLTWRWLAILEKFLFKHIVIWELMDSFWWVAHENKVHE